MKSIQIMTSRSIFKPGTVALPARDDSQPLTRAVGVQALRAAAGVTVCEVASGCCEIERLWQC